MSTPTTHNDAPHPPTHVLDYGHHALRGIPHSLGLASQVVGSLQAAAAGILALATLATIDMQHAVALQRLPVAGISAWCQYQAPPLAQFVLLLWCALQGAVLVGIGSGLRRRDPWVDYRMRRWVSRQLIAVTLLAAAGGVSAYNWELLRAAAGAGAVSFWAVAQDISVTASVGMAHPLIVIIASRWLGEPRQSTRQGALHSPRRNGWRHRGDQSVASTQDVTAEVRRIWRALGVPSLPLTSASGTMPPSSFPGESLCGQDHPSTYPPILRAHSPALSPPPHLSAPIPAYPASGTRPLPTCAPPARTCASAPPNHTQPAAHQQLTRLSPSPQTTCASASASRRSVYAPPVPARNAGILPAAPLARPPTPPSLHPRKPAPLHCPRLRFFVGRQTRPMYNAIRRGHPQRALLSGLR
jgi:hypothetical protein